MECGTYFLALTILLGVGIFFKLYTSIEVFFYYTFYFRQWYMEELSACIYHIQLLLVKGIVQGCFEFRRVIAENHGMHIEVERNGCVTELVDALHRI